MPGAVVGTRFRAAHAAGGPWPALARACLEQLFPLPDGANLGFLYVTDALAGDLANVLAFLRERTRIADWVGGVGLGICAAGVETFECPGLAVMVAALPKDGFRVFGPIAGVSDRFHPEIAAWVARRQPVVGVVHGDPRCAEIDDMVAAVSAAQSTFLVGGITSARLLPLQIAGRVVERGLSGVLLAPEIVTTAGLSQGCSPIGPIHVVSEAQGNVIIAIDGRPALDVFKEEIGELLSRDLNRVPGLIFAGFPITGSDAGGFLVRNLLAVNVRAQTAGLPPPDRAWRRDPVLPP